MTRRRTKVPQLPAAPAPTPAQKQAVITTVIRSLVAQRAREAEERTLRAAPPTLALGELSPRMQHAVADADTDWTTQQTLDGTQRAAGVLALERNPQLRPYQARGFASNPGLWWELRNLPETGSVFARMTRELSTTPLRLEPATLPEWASEVDEHLASMQYELASRWFYAWQQDPERRLADMVRDVVDYAPACGFCTLELTGTPGVIRLSDGYEVRSLIPNVPAPIAPWTTRYWITQGRALSGAIYDFSSVADYDGTHGDNHVFVPAHKLVVVSFDQTGQHYEGRSLMRPVFNQLHQLADLYRLQALGAEVHALGELWFTQQATAGPGGGTAPTLTTEAVNQLLYLLDNRCATFVPGALLPPGVEPVYGQSKANMPDLTPMIRVLREAVSLVMGDEHRLMGTGAVGSYAARKDASDDSKEPLDFFAETLIARPLETVLARFLALAFPGAPVFTPRIAWGAVDLDTSSWVQDVAAANGAGLLDHPDFGDQVRDALNLPPMAPADLTGFDASTLPNDRFIPVRDAAAFFGVSAGVIRRLLDSGDLEGRRVGSRYSVLVSSIRAYAAATNKAAQPAATPAAPVV